MEHVFVMTPKEHTFIVLKDVQSKSYEMDGFVKNQQNVPAVPGHVLLMELKLFVDAVVTITLLTY